MSLLALTTAERAGELIEADCDARDKIASSWSGARDSKVHHAAGVRDQGMPRDFDRLCLPPVEPLQLDRSCYIVTVRRCANKSALGH